MVKLLVPLGPLVQIWSDWLTDKVQELVELLFATKNVRIHFLFVSPALIVLYDGPGLYITVFLYLNQDICLDIIVFLNIN